MVFLIRKTLKVRGLRILHPVIIEVAPPKMWRYNPQIT